MTPCGFQRRFNHCHRVPKNRIRDTRYEHVLTTAPVYNHVLRLNLITRQWNLVDNYGDIPGVRMGIYVRPLFAPACED